MELTQEQREEGKVLVKRPDPKTGELREEVVSKSSFREKRPTWPTPDNPRFQEREAEYWDYYRAELAPREKRSIQAGAFSVLRPQPPAWERGDQLEVASRLTVTVESVDDTAKGFRTTFCVRNDRPIFPRRVPGVFDPPEVDEYGTPVPPTAEAIARARIDGNYTSSKAQSVPGTEDEMDDALHARIHGEADAENAIRGIKQQVRAEQLEIEERMAAAYRRGNHRTVRTLKRRLDSGKKRLDETE